MGFNNTGETHEEVQKWLEVYGVYKTVSAFVENHDHYVWRTMELVGENHLLNCPGIIGEYFF